jgi:hypothetical protein
MNVCPNCANPVREAARFCTSCGTALDGTPQPYLAPPLTPTAAEEPAVAPVWPEPPTSNTWPQPQSEPGWPMPAAPQGGWSTPAPQDGWPASDDQSWRAKEPVAASWPDPAPAEDRPSAEVAALSPDLLLEPSLDEMPALPVQPDLPELPAEIADFSDGAIAVEPAIALPVYSLSPDAASDAIVARERAGELLGELRDLLPRLSNPSGADPIALAAVLEAGITSDRNRWNSLRSVMENARDNPRDVETVLALSQRVDDVIALLDRHEQLTEAVQRAARQLRGE